MSVPDKAQTRARNLFHSYRRGYRDQAGGKGYDVRFEHHADPTLTAEYNRGQEDAKNDSQAALARACERTGYRSTILRSAPE